MIVAMIDYTFRLKELHPALRVPCEDWRSKLESLSVKTFTYAVDSVGALNCATYSDLQNCCNVLILCNV